MIKKKLYGIAVILVELCVVFSFVGCSEEGKDAGTALHASHAAGMSDLRPQVKGYSIDTTKKSFDPDLIDYSYDNADGLRLQLDDEALSIDYQALQPIENIQFFIDTDNDAATGNQVAGGADYMVENGYLFVSSDPLRWRWQEVGKIESVMTGSRRFSLRIERDMLPDLKERFGVSVQLFDTQWHQVAKSPEYAAKSLYTTALNKVQWDDIPAFVNEADAKIHLYHDGSNLYIRVEQPKAYTHIQLCIDTDNDSDTGYHVQRWQEFGYEYMIEDGILYQHSGKSDVWRWQKRADIAFVRKRIQDREIVEMVIPEKYIAFRSQLKLAVMTHNLQWSDTEYLPAKKIHPFVPSAMLTLKIDS